MIFLLHIAAFAAGFILDLIFGDPQYPFHPVRLIGLLIEKLEKLLNREASPASKRRRGFLTVCLVSALPVILSAALLFFLYKIHFILFFIAESLMTWQLIAVKSLRIESMKVYYALKNEGLGQARKALSMIVGRDTQNLSQEQICKACIETIAESTCDGIIAPLFYCALGGPVLGFFSKASNTMDSMIAYKNERFIDFGRAAAKLDDFLNFIPARLAAAFMIAGCFFLGKSFSAGDAVKIFLRDRFNHQSPNSAQTESVCAGALGLKLAGPAYYEGKLEGKPFIGDEKRLAKADDIRLANRLMYAASILFELFCLSIMMSLYFTFWRGI